MVIRPPEIVSTSIPVIFLAGPIQNAPEWHQEAIAMFPTTTLIACPKREGHRKPLEVSDYAAQVDWETTYLNRASESGIILFWLPVAVSHNCDRPYAQTTRFELGEWWTKASNYDNNIKLLVGIEKGFPNERYLKHRLSKNMEIYTNLQDICSKARALYKELK